jgi:hypothetical protein
VNPSVGDAVWAALGAAVACAWAWSARAGSSLARPSALLRRVCTGVWSRVGIAVVVMWLGWHLFAR